VVKKFQSGSLNKKSSRKDKLTSSVKKELAQLINSKQVKNLKDNFKLFSTIVSLTKVNFKNYQYINVWVSVLEKKFQTEIIELLNNSSPQLALKVSQRLKLRIVPKIVFEEDSMLERESKILSIINSFSNS